MGARHGIDRGAPGVAIQLQLGDGARAQLAERRLAIPAAVLERARARGCATSHDEVVEGLSSVAVPVRLPGRPLAALAIVHVARPGDPAVAGARLRVTARELELRLG